MILADDMDKPHDHDDRMAIARLVAQWCLGDKYWADEIVNAYMYPTMADWGQYEDD